MIVSSRGMYKVKTNQNEYGIVDIMKLICAYLVCLLHIPIFVKHPGFCDQANFYMMQYLCRIATPFFFISSGYFLFSKADPNNPDGKIVKDYCFRIARLWAFWTIILFITGNDYLWYLQGLIVATIIHFFCLRKLRGNYKLIISIAFVIYIYGCFHESYEGVLLFNDNKIISFDIKVFNFLFKSVKNGFTFGFMFVSLGAYIAQRKSIPKVLPSIIGFLSSMLLFLLEVIFLKKYNLSSGYNLRIFQVPTVYFLFLICISLKGNDKLDYKIIRNISVLVYFLHGSVRYFIGFVLDFVNYRLGIPIYNNQFIDLTFFVTIIFTTQLSWFVVYLSRKHRWLRYLYS